MKHSITVERVNLCFSCMFTKRSSRQTEIYHHKILTDFFFVCSSANRPECVVVQGMTGEGVGVGGEGKWESAA